MDGSHADIIETLGGPTVVAKALGVSSPNTVHYWTRPGRRIPSKYWHLIAALNENFTADVIASASKPNQPAKIRKTSGVSK